MAIMLIRILLVCLALAGGPVMATVEPSLQSPAELVDAFHEALEQLDDAGDDASAAASDVVARAGALLTRHGTLWYPAFDAVGVIVIAPVRFGSSLNALAYRLRKHVGGLELRFDPLALKKENAGAIYYDDTHQLLLSAEEVASGKAADYLAHEIVHAQNVHALSRGIDNLFMGWISGGDATQFHEAYGPRFSIDELQAYVQQARANVRALVRDPERGDVQGTLEMLDSGLALANATADTARQAANAIASLMRSRSRRNTDEVRTINERPERVVGYSGRGASVYLHRYRFPARFVEPSPVVRAVVEFDDLALELMIPAAFPPASTGGTIAAVMRRTQSLARRASVIAARFEAIRALVDATRFESALELANGIAPLVRRKPPPMP